MPNTCVQTVNDYSCTDSWIVSKFVTVKDLQKNEEPKIVVFLQCSTLMAECSFLFNFKL